MTHAIRAQALIPNRVYRFYRGGALLARLRGEVEVDGSFPEDWVASVTPASNPGRSEPQAGLSRLADGRLLRDAIEGDRAAWLGHRHVERFGASTGLLVKLLDAAERLPVHAHPSRAFARERLASQFGKTEAWIVVATRGDSAEVWIGLAESVARERYRAWIDAQDTEALLASLNRIEVRAGDIVYVPAGVPHAIGAGVLILELQEPTDFSLVCEWKGYPIRPEDAHLGLGWEDALRALDLEPHDPVRRLPAEARGFFWADEATTAAGHFAVLVVVAGEGSIAGLPARAGDGFVVPATVRDLEAAGDLRIVRCLGPDPDVAP
ncbi:MAG: class I mannose-6-phosphate isomerase [Actinomycetota bacterium]|nr:class I mannose-6-phosphate isomerase [Actinomycetota bacterium]